MSTETIASPAMSTGDPDYPATGTMTDTSVTTSNGTTACATQPELTKGPYYTDENPQRLDTRAGSDTGEREDGVRLDPEFKALELTEDNCTSLDDAIVDVWYVNASGVYSDVEMQNTVRQGFLRGIQLASDTGAASLTTVYPGWHTGHTIHVHSEIRSLDDTTEAYEFTSQLFFDDDLIDRVYTQTSYTDHGNRNILNSEGSIFQQDNMAQPVLDPTKTSEGYSGTLNVALYTFGETAADDSFSVSDGGPGESPGGSEPSGDSSPSATMSDMTTE